VCLLADPLALSPPETALFKIAGIIVLFFFCLYENLKQSISLNMRKNNSPPLRFLFEDKQKADFLKIPFWIQ